MVAVTLIWLLELLLLPCFYPPRAFSIPQESLATLFPQIESWQSDNQKDISQESIAATLNYDFISHKCIIIADDNLSYMTVDGVTGIISGPFIDRSALFSKYSALGWLHPQIQNLISLPLEIFFILLSITGFMIYWRNRKRFITLTVASGSL
jgi:hypothetical protein